MNEIDLSAVKRWQRREALKALAFGSGVALMLGIAYYTMEIIIITEGL